MTLELDFQAKVKDAIDAPGRRTRIFRQNVGTVVKRDRRGEKIGVFHAGPPKGAADLSGIVRPYGWRLEVELKSATAEWTPAQKRWRAFILAWGGIQVIVRYDERLSMTGNVAAAVADIDAAIEERRSRAA